MSYTNAVINAIDMLPLDTPDELIADWLAQHHHRHHAYGLS